MLYRLALMDALINIDISHYANLLYTSITTTGITANFFAVMDTNNADINLFGHVNVYNNNGDNCKKVYFGCVQNCKFSKHFMKVFIGQQFFAVIPITGMPVFVNRHDIYVLNVTALNMPL
jgi:hypothetical protein